MCKKFLLWAIDWPGRLQREDIGQSWYFSIYCLTRRRSPFQIKKNMLQFRTVTKLMTIIGSRKNLQTKKMCLHCIFLSMGDEDHHPPVLFFYREKERTDGRTTVWEFELIPWAYKLTSLQLHAQELFRIVLSAKGLISRADREDSSMSVNTALCVCP